MNRHDLNLKSHKKTQEQICWDEGIRMLEEAPGCCEGVSGCTEKASRCVHLPAPETTNRTLEKMIKSNFKHTIWTKLGKIKSQEARNNAITNKRIETQRIKEFKPPKICSWHCVYIYIYIYNLIWLLAFLIKGNEPIVHYWSKIT